MFFRGFLVLKNPYTANYKRYIALPVIFAVLMLFFIFVSPGVKPGLDLKGGTMLIVQSDQGLDADLLEATLKENFDLEELKVTSTGLGVRVQYSQSTLLTEAQESLEEATALLSSNPENAKQKAMETIQLVAVLLDSVPNLALLAPEKAVETARNTVSLAEEEFNINVQETVLQTLNLSVEEARFQKKEVGTSLGRSFWQNAINVTIAAIILITIVIFIFFREFVPSVAIIMAAIIDILAALGGMSLFGIPLSLSTIPALLMLVGYSIDTDILLTTRLLKKRGETPAIRALDSMKTGLTMTSTTLVAVLVMLVLSYYAQITIIFEISAVLFFGLIGDVISTWFMNAPILLWYAERKKKRF